MQRMLQRVGEESGQSAVLFALLLFVIMLGVGFGVDLSRVHLARAEVQAALDASSLAGVQTDMANPSNTAGAQAVALQIFTTNIRSNDPQDKLFSGGVSNFSSSIQPGTCEFHVQTTITVPTVIMSALGLPVKQVVVADTSMAEGGKNPTKKACP